jgi:hypothetical protein
MSASKLQPSLSASWCHARYHNCHHYGVVMESSSRQSKISTESPTPKPVPFHSSRRLNSSTGIKLETASIFIGPFRHVRGIATRHLFVHHEVHDAGRGAQPSRQVNLPSKHPYGITHDTIYQSSSSGKYKNQGRNCNSSPFLRFR